MKSIVTIAAAGMLVVGLAEPAAAFRVSPARTHFVAAGPASATLNGVTLNCRGKFRLVVNKVGKGKITAVSFSGGTGCSTVGVAGLPWAITATSASTATITNADFTSKGGPCGPANMAMTVSGGVIAYNAAFDQCSQVSLSLTTTPTLSIVP